jgi:hypothetical protein
VPGKLLLAVESTTVVNLGYETIRTTTFIFADRKVVASEVANTFDRKIGHQRSLPDYSKIMRGTLPPDVFAFLVSALGAARAGVAQDCFNVDTDAGLLPDYRITWYGKGKRRNTFLASTQLDQNPCTLEMDALLRSIEDVRGVILSSPDSEILLSPP